MGIMDAFNPEDRVDVKFSDFYTLMQAAAEAQANLHYIENAVIVKIPFNSVAVVYHSEGLAVKMLAHLGAEAVVKARKKEGRSDICHDAGGGHHVFVQRLVAVEQLIPESG